MLANQGQAAECVVLLSSADAADTAAATSAWVDARKYEGDLVFIVNVGTVTGGSVALAVQHATASDGTGAAAITPNEGAFTTVTTSNDPLVQKRTVSANAIGGWVRIVGTVTTGPVQIAAELLAHPKYTS